MYSYLNKLTLYTGVLYSWSCRYSFSSWPHSDITSLGYSVTWPHLFYSRYVFGIVWLCYQNSWFMNNRLIARAYFKLLHCVFSSNPNFIIVNRLYTGDPDMEGSIVNSKWQTRNPCLLKSISQKRLIYSNRTVSYPIVLLELLTILLDYIIFFCDQCFDK